MGHSSYDCKHCGHAVLSDYSVDPEINAWMKEAVVLTRNGSRMIGEHDGYGDIGGGSVADGSIPMGDAVWAHVACWEVAGKPEFSEYDGPSESSADQGFFFDDAHDMIDPRITDEAERERLLREGVAVRDRRRYDDRARRVADWLAEDEYADEDVKRQPWRHRFSCHAAYEDGKKLENLWWFEDRIPARYGGLPEFDADGELIQFAGTREEAEAHLASLWAQFVESDECRAYLERSKAMYAEARERELQRLKEKGRFEVSYGPAPAGDTIEKASGRDWVGSRTIYRVEDRLTYRDVAKMDGPDKALGVKTFVEDPDYAGNCSPEWEARVEDLRAAARESRRLAEEECQRLNDEWARAGYPMPPPEEW